MDLDIPIDVILEIERDVTKEASASHIGSGTVAVLATPSMLLFMEIAAGSLLQKYLPEGYTSVGISVNIKHEKAIKVGEKVIAKAEIKKCVKRTVDFHVEVTWQDEIVGQGTHSRVIINTERFLSKL